MYMSCRFLTSFLDDLPPLVQPKVEEEEVELCWLLEDLDVEKHRSFRLGELDVLFCCFADADRCFMLVELVLIIDDIADGGGGG